MRYSCKVDVCVYVFGSLVQCFGLLVHISSAEMKCPTSGKSLIFHKAFTVVKVHED